MYIYVYPQMVKIALPGEAWPTGYVFDVPRWRRNVPDNKPWRPFYLLNRVVPGDAATLDANDGE